MNKIVIEGIDDALMRDLEASAEEHHRSINEEALARLQGRRRRTKEEKDAVLAMANELQSKYTGPRIDIAEVCDMIRRDREHGHS